jgi:hypothetical protein
MPDDDRCIYVFAESLAGWRGHFDVIPPNGPTFVFNVWVRGRSNGSDGDSVFVS